MKLIYMFIHSNNYVVKKKLNHLVILEFATYSPIFHRLIVSPEKSSMIVFTYAVSYVCLASFFKHKIILTNLLE